MATVNNDFTRESAPAKSLRTAVLLVFLLYFATPALWVFFAITKDPSQIFTTFGLWFAQPLHFFENVSELFSYQGGIYARWFGNSIIYATTISAVSTMICAAGAYAFAKYDFWGRKALFSFILGTIMVPNTALFLPLFLFMNKLGLIDTYWGVILPGLVNPFGLYLMRVFWDTGFPTDLLEAARLDGASELRIFWSVGLPLMPTGLVTVALLSFVGAWNNFFLPLIVLNRENLFPLTLGMNVWNTLIHTGGGKPIYNLVALGSLISVLPLLGAFIFLGRYWQGGITAGATKG